MFEYASGKTAAKMVPRGIWKQHYLSIFVDVVPVDFLRTRTT